MKIRDSLSKINGDDTEYIMPSGGVEIIADDGKTLFDIKLWDNGMLSVNGGICCKHNGIILDDCITIIPRASNEIYITRPPYNQ